MKRVIAALCGMLLLASCSWGHTAAVVESAAVEQDLVLDASSPAVAALSATYNTLETARVVIFASTEQESNASAIGEKYGIPVLLADADLHSELMAELRRLGVQTLLLTGTQAPKNWQGRTADISQVERAVSKFSAPVRTEFPVVTNGDYAAARANLQAAGGKILDSPADPRADAEVIAELSGTAAAVALLQDANSQTLPILATVRGGKLLPGGGQLVFHGKRYVALYGTPHTPLLGLLGEQGVPETIARAAQLAAEYQTLTTDKVIPALEVIATVASAGPGEDGNYSNEYPVESFRALVEQAAAADQYVILDLQPGRADFLTQVQSYAELLKYPNVGVALDPEWRLEPDQLPLQQIGHVEITEVNSVINYLADFVKAHHLPQKMLILHQFQVQMIRDIDQLDQSRAELAILLHVDGQGSQPAKWGTWSTLRKNSPNIAHWGWKNFIDEDVPMLNPAQTYEIKPLPHYVSYQ
ncbi:MAG: hypothetical protein Q4E03_00660 [Trueperella sp.]|nr:hypothetical protein [Trueperella sp.]